MSVTASIDIKIETRNIIELLENLFALGWNYDDNGKITYLPIHDEDYDWKNVDLSSFEKVKKELVEKITYNEVLGIVILWENSNVGGLFNYFTSTNEISFILTINRRVIANSEITDFSWYIEKIIPAMVNCKIEGIVCSDTY